jgi:hypothetical protein
MPVAPTKGAQKKAYDIARRLTLAAGSCQRCGSPGPLDCAHVITRQRWKTFCDLENLVALCRACHRAQHAGLWVFPEVIGQDRYDRLVDKVRMVEKRPKFWWDEELARLRKLEREAA